MIFLSKMFWKCVFSPKLYIIYRERPEEALYKYHYLEMWSERIISSMSTALNIGIYTSPFICIYLYRRGFSIETDLVPLANIFGTIGCILLTSLLVRAYCRATNPKYMQFLRTLHNEGKVSEETHLENIREYDFDFNAWPVSFKMQQCTNSRSSMASPFNQSANEDLPLYSRTLLQLLAYIAINTFALRLIYPGTLGIIQSLMWGPIVEGRTTLVQQNGKRNKLVTCDGNSIDTMYVDKRPGREGDILVICCDGNSGFYEVGIMGIPIKAGYSALGWNHPGFACSTGLPYLPQEQNAIDAVLQFAIEKLNFKPENIVMFGWSIGGYSAAWAASQYPVRGIILDATFDDLLPLAESKMPSSWSLLVKEVIRSHVDLHVSKLVNLYKGSVHIIRRTEDEIICLDPAQLSSNRGNDLIIDIIRHNYPEVDQHYGTELIKYANMPADRRPNFDSILIKQGDEYVLKLLQKYTTDFKSTHCTMLPHTVFADIMRTHIITVPKKQL